MKKKSSFITSREKYMKKNTLFDVEVAEKIFKTERTHPIKKKIYFTLSRTIERHTHSSQRTGR